MWKSTESTSGIVIIYGASGSGKSTFIKRMRNRISHVTIHMKGTTRSIRRKDSDDIRYLSFIPKWQYEIVYTAYGFKYGIERRQIDNAIINNELHFVICSDIETVERLQQYYKGFVTTLFLYLDEDRNTLLQIQQRRGISENQVAMRLAAVEKHVSTFIEMSHNFNGVIRNSFSNTKDCMCQQFDTIWTKLREVKKN